MQKAKAVEIWSRLEEKLLALGLPADKLMVSRAELIRAIGEVEAGTRRKKIVDALMPVIPPQNFAPAITEVRHTVHDLGDTIHDEKLATYLDRACRGYSGDDSVDYR